MFVIFKAQDNKNRLALQEKECCGVVTDSRRNLRKYLGIKATNYFVY